ncbi:HalOD1 output domain-containing protein [Natribaculum luteum]|uniref:HalOD1 output domain-containing protein n=1 Tax=Natribaculum luteum TaxID=1586232 RepID=A0ABD5P405_9EURY|nr:HalOD1 output domain-containing protein [Natribaculum luteum]
MTRRSISDGGFDRDGPTSSSRFAYEVDPDERRSEAVVRAVAALTNTSPLELEPLYEVIDPESLDRTFAETDGAVSAEISFAFDDCAVTVTRKVIYVHVTVDEE